MARRCGRHDRFTEDGFDAGLFGGMFIKQVAYEVANRFVQFSTENEPKKGGGMESVPYLQIFNAHQTDN